MLAPLLTLAVLGVVQPAASPGPPVPLAEAVQRARRESPLRASAASIADGTEAAARVAGRPLNPLVDVRAENLAPNHPLAPDRDVFAVVSQPFELGAKRKTRRQLAEADHAVSSLLLRVVERQIALDTVRAYMRALRAREVLATLTTQREGVGLLVTTMRLRVDEGFAPGSDLLRFEAEAARVSAELSRTNVELTRALQDLSAIIGASTPLTADQLVSPDSVPPPAIDDDGLVAAVARRPDVQLAAARVDRAQVAADLERLRRIPDPSITGGYKRTQGQNTAVAGLVVAVPLFDTNAQARALAEATVRAASFDREVAQTRAMADARAAVAAAVALADSVSRVQRDLLAPAEGVRDAAQATFREGAADVLKLVDAERIYTDVRREALSLAIDAYLAAIDARFALDLEEIP